MDIIVGWMIKNDYNMYILVLPGWAVISFDNLYPVLNDRRYSSSSSSITTNGIEYIYV